MKEQEAVKGKSGDPNVQLGKTKSVRLKEWEVKGKETTQL